jgi:acetyltransferase-like isoleucine patch superfamily enzyme
MTIDAGSIANDAPIGAVISPMARVLSVMSRWRGGIRRRIRAGYLRMKGMQLGKSSWIQKVDIPRNHWDICLGDGVALDRDVTLLSTGDWMGKARIIVGSACYINRCTMIDASVLIRIGKRCMIGPFCYITDHDHGTQSGTNIGAQPLVSVPVFIGDDVWIGAGAVILKGVIIGDGAVIGAGAVVTRNVEPSQVVAGVPARLLKDRR